MNTTLLKIILPSGNPAVYECQPQHRDPKHIRQYSKQVATHIQGAWYSTGLVQPLDAAASAALNALPVQDYGD